MSPLINGASPLNRVGNANLSAIVCWQADFLDYTWNITGISALMDIDYRLDSIWIGNN